MSAALGGDRPFSAAVPKRRTSDLPPAGGKRGSPRAATGWPGRGSAVGARSLPPLFSPSTGRRQSSFRTQRSHGKPSLRALRTHRLPSSRGRGRQGPWGPLAGWPDGREGSAACRAGPGALESEGAQQPRRRGGIGAAGGRAWVSVPATQSVSLTGAAFFPARSRGWSRTADDGPGRVGSGSGRRRTVLSAIVSSHGLSRLNVAGEHLFTAIGVSLCRGQPRTGHLTTTELHRENLSIDK